MLLLIWPWWQFFSLFSHTPMQLISSHYLSFPFPCLRHVTKYVVLEKCYEYMLEGQNHRAFSKQWLGPEAQTNDTGKQRKVKNRKWYTQQSWACRLWLTESTCTCERSVQEQETIKGLFKGVGQQKEIWPQRGKITEWLVMLLKRVEWEGQTVSSEWKWGVLTLWVH